MLRTRVFLLAAVILLVIILYSLPRVVVENDPQGVTSARTETTEDVGSTMQTHDLAISETDSLRIERWRVLAKTSGNSENSAIFADSLAELFFSYGSYDSAAKYFDISAERTPTVEKWEKAGSAYYEAFSFTFDVEKARSAGSRARFYFDKVLEVDPTRLDLKTKSAMTLVSSNTPMQGIMMLREVLEEDPANQDALFNLGLLALQTGQWERAAGRFEELIQVNDQHVQGHFYLALCYKQLDRVEEARRLFERVKELDADEEVIATVDAELEDMQ